MPGHCGQAEDPQSRGQQPALDSMSCACTHLNEVQSIIVVILLASMLHVLSVLVITGSRKASQGAASHAVDPGRHICTQDSLTSTIVLSNNAVLQECDAHRFARARTPTSLQRLSARSGKMVFGVNGTLGDRT